MGQNIVTEATILSVEDDATWKYSVEAEIPAFDGDRSYRYLAWNKKQGPPPQVGAVGRGTFESYQRAKYYVERGDIEAGPVDGTEKKYMVTWNMVAFVPGGANGSAPTQSATPTANNAIRTPSDVPAASGATYLSAPTADERLAKELAKERRKEEGVNDRKAVSDILAMVAPGMYLLDGLIEDATKLAMWYNARLAARCESPLVQTAQTAGAVVTSVDLFDELDEPGDGPPLLTLTPSPALQAGKEVNTPALKNKAELAEWVTTQGWSKGQISGVLQGAGHASSSDYLQETGNTVQGLAELLRGKLDW